MKRFWIVVVMAILSMFPVSRALAANACTTNSSSGVSYCTGTTKCSVNSTSAPCIQPVTLNNGVTYNILAYNGWAAINVNPLNKSVTVMDCLGNWAAVAYKATVAASEPTNFRVCNGNDFSGVNCAVPSHVHVDCQGTHNGQDSVVYDISNTPPLPFQIPDVYSGLEDTDALGATFQHYLPTLNRAVPVQCPTQTSSLRPDGLVVFAGDAYQDGTPYSSCSGS